MDTTEELRQASSIPCIHGSEVSVARARGGGYPSVPRNPLGKICWVKSEVLSTSDIGSVGPMWGKLLRRLGRIRGIDVLGPNPTYPTSEVSTDDCTFL